MPEKTPEPWGALAESPADAQISVTVPPRAHARPLRRRLARGPLVLAVPVAVAITAGAVLTATGGRYRGAAPARGNRAAAAEVATAYGYPSRCLTISFSPGDPEYARAQVDRTAVCARYRGYVNASFHRIDGSWRLELDEGQLFVPNAALGARPAATPK
jgi:hypothetical protein